MKSSMPGRIWGIIYPLLIYFLMDVIIVWAVQMIITGPSAPTAVSGNTAALASIIFLAFSIPVFYFFIYKKDFNEPSGVVFKKPWIFAVLIVLGALASHGLSALVSYIIPENIVGNYDELQTAVFSASPVLVVLQTVILAPLSEEILFRGIVYKRLERLTGNFWAAALISSAVFGIYHMNLTQGIFAFVFGILICMVYSRFRNLWACFAVHAGGNLLSVILVYTGFDYDSPAVYLTVAAAALALSAGICIILLRKFRTED